MRTLNRWTVLGLSCLGLTALAQAPAPAPLRRPRHSQRRHRQPPDRHRMRRPRS